MANCAADSKSESAPVTFVEHFSPTAPAATIHHLASVILNGATAGCSPERNGCHDGPASANQHLFLTLAWFLGAGTSAVAGLPTATDIIWGLKRRYYCREE